MNGVVTRFNSELQRTNTRITRIDGATRRISPRPVVQLENQFRRLNRTVREGDGVLSGFQNKLSALASTYLGVMTFKAVIETSDTITAAENKFNVQNGGNAALTQQTLDKIYSASQESRSGYSAAISNVGKLMINASKSFDDNIDKAIVFNKLMEKSYVIGGASAQEQHQSMYQLVQALGSGVLQGDELRSVREGAQVAYKYIEEYAQELYKSDEALKEMAADGKITSDIVTEAIIANQDKINAAFDMTQTTFAQTWNMFKNSATKAFEPVFQKMNKALNSKKVQSMLNKLTKAIFVIADAVCVFFDVISAVTEFIYDNWGFFRPFFYAIATVIGTMTIAFGLYSISTTIATIANSEFVASIAPLLIAMGTIAVSVAAVVSVYERLREAGRTTADALWQAMMIVAGGLLILTAILYGLAVAFGVAWASALWPVTLVIAAILAVVALFIWAGNYITGALYVIFAFIWNLFIGLFDGVLESINVLANAWLSFSDFFANIFNDPIASIIKAFEGLGNAVLGILNAIAKAIDAVFGSNLSGVVSGWMSSLSGWADKAAQKYGNGTYKESEKLNLSAEKLGLKRWSYSNAWGTGMKHGTIASDWLVNGLTGGWLGGKTVTPTFDAAQFGSSGIADNILGAGDKTADNTGKTAKNTEKLNEDFSYLRDLAEMETINRFTTAEIKIDMTNNNHIENGNDLDGIVTHLSQKLMEEMNVVAEGVYS